MALTTALQTCMDLGVPVAPDKIEAPSTGLTFLGLYIDSVKGELRLPEDKTHHLRSEVESWIDRKVCVKRDLLSLIGLLHHAASVVRLGRPFVCHLINRSKVARHDHFKLRLDASTRSDLLWWHVFLSQWNGISILPLQQPQVLLTSDASGSWGAGAYCGSNWFQLEWPGPLRASNIATLELIPVVVATAVWGSAWHSAHIITCHCDNEAVVHTLNKGSAKDPALAQLLRCLAFYLTHYHLSLSAQHVAGSSNAAADALSRNDLKSFFASPTGSTQPNKDPRRSGSADHPGETRLDVQALERAVSSYFTQGLASSTAKTYRSAQQRYSRFCMNHGLPPILLSEATLCMFVSSLALDGIKHSSIKCYISATRHMQIAAGLADPFAHEQWSKLNYVLKGIKRNQSRGQQPHPRLPITPAILLQIQDYWSGQNPPSQDRVMLWAAFMLGFFGFLRAGEFTIPSVTSFDPETHLAVSDVAVDNRVNPSLLRVHIKCSKTDPFRRGYTYSWERLATAYAQLKPWWTT